MSVWAIGDVHGMTKSYVRLLRNIRKFDKEAITFQVGDMGVGFSDVAPPECSPNDFWISGNHDNHEACLGIAGYLGDFGFKEISGRKIFWVRGAKSTDREHRTENEDWWACEQLSYAKLTEAVALYEQVKPDIVISHECPSQARPFVCMFGRDGGDTLQALTMMYSTHQPKVWAFGHHHYHSQHELGDTLFTCCGELRWKKLC